MSPDRPRGQYQRRAPGERVEVLFKKSNFCRTVHVDGAWGAGNPTNNMVHVAIFSEYATLPDSVSYVVEPTGPMLDTSIQIPQSITREIEVELMMTAETALSIARWLITRVEELNQAKTAIASEESEEGAE